MLKLLFVQLQDPAGCTNLPMNFQLASIRVNNLKDQFFALLE
jgi:hypothetical protein